MRSRTTSYGEELEGSKTEGTRMKSSFLLSMLWLQLAAASFLKTPRINFAGQFRADVATYNNDNLNFLLSEVNDNDMIKSWNKYGSNSWSLVNCKVTSVAMTDPENGKTTIKTDDPVVGKLLVNNVDSASAKLVDVDPDQQQSSTIYGMSLGINWDPSVPQKNKSNGFYGDFEPSTITRDLWSRQIKSNETLQQPFAGHSVSRLKNVVWSSNLESEALTLLKKKTVTGELSITFSVFNYTRPPHSDLFLYGNVVGSIGIAEEKESLVFPENRVMEFHRENLLPVSEIPDDSNCKNIGSNQWMTTTYFDVVDSKMTIDFGNSLPIAIDGTLCKLLPFYVGILSSEISTQVEVIAEIPYMKEKWFLNTSGIQDFDLKNHHQDLLLIDKSKIVVVASNANIASGKLYPLCSSSSTAAKKKYTCVFLILEETPCLVRPMDYFVYRMEQGNNIFVSMKVRHYGRISDTSKSNEAVMLFDQSVNGAANNQAGIEYDRIAYVDDAGMAKFSFTAGDVGNPRASLHIDGQVFRFGYCSKSCMEDCEKCVPAPTNIGNYLVFLIWSPVSYDTPYFWDPHIKPIFTQYQHLYPVMNNILKLGDFDDVIKPHNIRLLQYSMSLSIYHPSHMPVTRDLSPKKTKMILDWLSLPEHYRNWIDLDARLYKSPHFCKHAVFVYDHSTIQQDNLQPSNSCIDNKEMLDISHARKKPTLGNSDIAHKFAKVASGEAIRANASFDWKAIANNHSQCTTKFLHDSLQTAIALEFSTIPPYMTALYSIKDGYNHEVYDIIRSVIMQEMLHMAQAANLLISIGGKPVIDDPNKIPKKYPTRLPGHVLPGLDVTLKKASPWHIYEVFMMIEFPEEIIYGGKFHTKRFPTDPDSYTIGEFYKTIRECMCTLNSKKPIQFKNEGKQLHWPWETTEHGINLKIISHIRDAEEAINMIIEQGEGTSQLDPTYSGTQDLAHFFKFEELACKHHVEASHEHHSYNFRGEEIEFVSEGVWPMRDNPSSSSLIVGSHVYHEAKVFHRIYRSLLKSLQKTFDGEPDAINDAVYIMEAMQLQAKKLMQLEVPVPEGHPQQTCGPIFDYDWEDQA